jgi:protein translocase SecG subunit
MKQLLNIITALAAIVLVVSVLLQNQGSGLGTAFGGESNFYRSKRGLEKVLFYVTIAAAAVMVGSILANIVIK